MLEAIVIGAYVLLVVVVGIAGACAALAENERPHRRVRVVLDRDAPLDWSEKAPDPRTGELMSRLAKEGMAVLAKERAQ